MHQAVPYLSSSPSAQVPAKQPYALTSTRASCQWCRQTPAHMLLLHTHTTAYDSNSVVLGRARSGMAACKWAASRWQPSQGA